MSNYSAWFRAIALFALTALAARAQATVVVDGHTGGLLGGWSKGKWIGSEEAGKLVQQDDVYQIVGPPVTSRIKGGAARPIEGPCGDSWEVPIPDLPAEAIAVHGGFGAKPLVPVEIPPASRVYQIAFRQVLDRNSIRSAVKIEQLWMVDLNGDRVNEVLASLYNAAKPGSVRNQPGDYAMVAIRMLDAERKVQTFVPELERYQPEGDDITHLRLGPIVDLNGDGVAEIVVRGSYSKGKFTHVYELQKGKFVRVLECTCGG